MEGWEEGSVSLPWAVSSGIEPPKAKALASFNEPERGSESLYSRSGFSIHQQIAKFMIPCHVEKGSL